MWLYFNQNGRLLEVSEYDGQARAGTTAFKIFAVFENIDIDTEYTQATLKLYKPDSNGGSYPIILMEKEDSVTFDGPNGIRFVHGQSYKCYSFDFSDLQSDDSPVVLLDIPGLWYAVITLRDARKINVVGSSSFNVQDGISSETDETEAFDAILDYFYRNYGDFVPYTGATRNVDLGDNYLEAGSINLQRENSQGASVKVNAGENSQSGAYGQLYVTDDYYSEAILELSDAMGFVTVYSPTSVKVLGNQYKISFPEVQKNEVFAVQSQLPKKGLIATFDTSSFVNGGSNYSISNIAVSGFIADSDMLVITWDNCFALCPIPQSGAGRVCAAMWNANGEAQTIRIRYELKDNNTKLDISLQGGFTPPSNHTAYVFNYKLV